MQTTFEHISSYAPVNKPFGHVVNAGALGRVKPIL